MALCHIEVETLIYSLRDLAICEVKVVGKVNACLFSTDDQWVDNQSKGLFTWTDGALANRATRLEGLTHSPPLHATHLTGTVIGLLSYLLKDR